MQVRRTLDSLRRQRRRRSVPSSPEAACSAGANATTALNGATTCARRSSCGARSVATASVKPRNAAVENLKAAGQRGAAAGAGGAKAVGRGAVNAGQQGADDGRRRRQGGGARRGPLRVPGRRDGRRRRQSSPASKLRAGVPIAGSLPAAVRRRPDRGNRLRVGGAAHDRRDRRRLPRPGVGARRSHAAPAEHPPAAAHRRRGRAGRRHHPRLRQRLRARHVDRASDRHRSSSAPWRWRMRAAACRRGCLRPWRRRAADCAAASRGLAGRPLVQGAFAVVVLAVLAAGAVMAWRSAVGRFGRHRQPVASGAARSRARGSA